MAEKINVHKNDNGVKLLFQITKDSLIEPLTNAKVSIKFVGKNTGNSFVRSAIITDENNAEAEYVLTSNDLSEVDVYATHVTTEYSNGTILTYDNPFLLLVKEKLVE